MSSKKTPAAWIIGAGIIALALATMTSMPAQQAGGTRGAAIAQSFMTTADANKDGFITREELRAAVGKWLTDGDTGKTGSLTQEQLTGVLDRELPASALMSMFSGGRGPQNQTPKPEDVQKMEAALPAKAPAQPKQPRKVLVLSKANGFVHSCIPLAAATVVDLGKKTGAWTATVSYDPAVINADNLKQYDLVMLNNTTGAFLDDPNDPTVTAARRKALLDFVRSGKGLAGIHAAADSYHQASGGPARGGQGRGARGGGMGGMIAGGIMTAADKNSDKKLTADELTGLADTWFDRLDTEKAGKISAQVFESRFGSVLMGGGRGGAPAVPAVGRPGPDTQTGTWPEFNHMIGGYFKYHWLNPQHIVYKIDDPDSPLTAMFKGVEFSVDDETYTFGINSWSRENLHVLTSIDYSKMSEADKLKEDYPRADHDYGLSWIRREGRGRVFYEAHGHDEHIYAITKMLEHLTAGMQYAMGDLAANDAPSKR